MAKKVRLEETDLPLGTNLNEEVPANEKTPSQAAAQRGARKDYAPAKDVLDRLDRLPKDEIKKELGLDIDYLVRTTKTRGTLEALAYGSFTKPVDLTLKTAHGARIRTKATVRIYSFSNGDWRPEIHPVRLKEKVDKEGRPVVSEDGRPVMTYDRNPITRQEVDDLRANPGRESPIEFNGKGLTADQLDRLRLTGNLGEAVQGTNMKGERISTVISVDPYNNHELCAISEGTLAKRLKEKESFVYTDDKGERREVQLNEKMRGELALGRGVWGTDDKGQNKYIQYNTATERLEIARNYEYEVKKERNASQAMNVGQQQANRQENRQENAPAKGVGAIL